MDSHSSNLPSGLYTSYTAHLHRDKALLKRLLKGVQKKRPWDVQSALLRRYLLELTQSFIIPLEHYMASLMPLQKNITPWKSPPPDLPLPPGRFPAKPGACGTPAHLHPQGRLAGPLQAVFQVPPF